MHRTIFVASLALSTFGLTGCAAADEHEAAEAAVASTLQASRSGAVGQIAAQSLTRESTATAPTACQAAASDLPPVGLYPQGCAVKTCANDRLHVEFTDCTGPFGRVHLFGGLDATFSKPAAGDGLIHADVKDDGALTANGRRLAYAAGADITVEDGARDITWTAHWSGTTKRGYAVTHDSSLDIRVDTKTDCHDIAGTTHGEVSGREMHTVIDGVVVCPDKCPSAGAVTVTRSGWLRDRTITIRFDGTDKAHVTGSRRHGDFDVQMVCEAD